VTFIDDHSKNTWIYIFKTKDELFENFKKFRSERENLIERKKNILDTKMGVNIPLRNLYLIRKKDALRGSS